MMEFVKKNSLVKSSGNLEAYIEIIVSCNKDNSDLILTGVVSGVENALKDFELKGRIHGFESRRVCDGDFDDVVFNVRGVKSDLSEVYKRLSKQFNNRVYKSVWGRAGVKLSVSEPRLL